MKPVTQIATTNDQGNKTAAAGDRLPFPRSVISRRIAFLGAGLAALAMAGCASIPASQSTAHPQTSVAMGNTVSEALASAEFTRGQGPSRNWWTAFGDPQLNRLEAQALSGNLDLRIAASRVAQAKQAAQVSRSGLAPQVTSDDSVIRQKFTENGLFPPPLGGSTNNIGNLGVSLSYDLDLWGQHRQEYASALSQAQAAALDAEEARRVVTTGIAQAYYNLAALGSRMKVAEGIVRERQGLQKISAARRSAGMGNDIAVAQSQADVAAEERALESLRDQAEALKYQIAALTGHGPDFAASITTPSALKGPATVAVPGNLPIDLLSRRPDIVAARWRAEAAGHDIKVAKAQFYPNVNLSAMIGLSSLALGNLLSPSSATWSAGPAVHLPIFDAGRLRANLGAKEAQYDIAVNQYNQSVLTAAREVATGLSALRSLRRQQSAEATTLAAAQKAYRLSELRYRNGMADFSAVLIAERDVLAARDADAQLAGERQQAVLNLIKALGGGFQPA